MNYWRDIMTSRKGDWSMTKLISAVASLAMTYNFVKSGSVNFEGYGIGVGAMIGALAAKHWTEDRPDGH